jgi:hypothetical protein
MTRSADTKGFALLTVIFVLAFLMGLAATMAVTVGMDTQLRGAFGRSMTGFYAAEAGLNKGMGDYKNIFLSFNVPSGSDFNQHTVAVGDRTVTYQLSSVGSPQTVPVPQGQPFAGTNALQSTYIAKSQATKVSGDVEASVGAEFLVGYIPLFQFLAFYNNDLEINPGAEMHLHGRIHANGDLYLGPDNHLYIEDSVANPTVQVSCKDDVYRGRKDDGSCNSSAAVTIDKLNGSPRDLNCSGGTVRKVPASELTAWGGSIKGQVRSIAVPQPDITIKDTGDYWLKADLRIVLRLDESKNLSQWSQSCPATGCPVYVIEVQNADGSQDTAKTQLLGNFMGAADWNNTSGKSSLRGTQPIFYTDRPQNANYTAFNGYYPPFNSSQRSGGSYVPYTDIMGSGYGSFDPDYRRGGFYNQREGLWMYLLNVNVHDLLQWNMDQPSSNRLFDPSDRTDGGIVLFLSVQGPYSNVANNYGVRVFGSRTLPFPSSIGTADPTGITVVSDQAVYVLGNFNSASWQPAAVIGDSLNILSNNYFNNTNSCRNDCQSYLALTNSSRNATTTNVYAAFLAGVDTTIKNGGRSTYNGGFENYPRFHESWSGQTLYYRGSFVSLGTPYHVVGPWCGTGSTCNIYNPPARNWDYDSNFNDPAMLPPATPRFVYVQQVLFTEDFR